MCCVKLRLPLLKPCHGETGDNYPCATCQLGVALPEQIMAYAYDDEIARNCSKGSSFFVPPQL